MSYTLTVNWVFQISIVHDENALEVVWHMREPRNFKTKNPYAK